MPKSHEPTYDSRLGLLETELGRLARQLYKTKNPAVQAKIQEKILEVKGRIANVKDHGDDLPRK